MKYQVRYSVNDSGARLMGSGLIAFETNSLLQAILSAKDLARCGKCGYVRRDDGKVLMPDNEWVN